METYPLLGEQLGGLPESTYFVEWENLFNHSQPIYDSLASSSPSTDSPTSYLPSKALSGQVLFTKPPEPSTSPFCQAEHKSSSLSSSKDKKLSREGRASSSLSQSTVSPPRRRRGPGRPSKSELAARGIDRNRSTNNAWRREVHNDSAMRSRAKFTSALCDLWQEVPEQTKMSAIGDHMGEISRADKIDIVISYMRGLQAKLNAE
jgi:hypothetical protein